MTASEQLRMIKNDFDRVKSAVGKAKEPIIKSMEGTISGRALRLLLDPAVVLHIDKKSFKKELNILPTRTFPDIFFVCDYLKSLNGLTHQDISNVKAFVKHLDDDVEEFAKEFLCKSLKLGLTLKTLNKCFESEKIEMISCMLANKYFEHPDVVIGKVFAITEKLDGIRCLAVVRPDEKPVLYSRQGKVITGLHDIERELLEISRKHNDGFVLDGELLIRDRKGIPSKEQYKKTMKIVTSDRDKKPGILFNAFDTVSLDAFDTQSCITPYYLRRQKLEILLDHTINVKPVPILYYGSDTSKIKTLVDEQRAMGHEGVMINLADAFYAFKRTNNLLKVKVMQDADLEILDVKEGEGKFAGTLGALIVNYKGTQVGVGSGLTDEVRREIWRNPSEYIGRVAKIRYFEETEDKNGVKSIRFPVFEEIREIGKEVSYA